MYDKHVSLCSLHLYPKHRSRVGTVHAAIWSCDVSNSQVCVLCCSLLKQFIKTETNVVRTDLLHLLRRRIIYRLTKWANVRALMKRPLRSIHCRLYHLRSRNTDTSLLVICNWQMMNVNLVKAFRKTGLLPCVITAPCPLRWRAPRRVTDPPQTPRTSAATTHQTCPFTLNKLDEQNGKP